MRRLPRKPDSYGCMDAQAVGSQLYRQKKTSLEKENVMPMEKNEGEFLMEVAKLLQKKYGHMVEVERLTEEMAQTLSRNDKVSARLVLGMRGEELQKIMECDKRLFLFRENALPKMKDWLRKALNGKNEVSSEEYGKEGALVARLSGNIRSIWEKIMVIDRHMNKRLAGKDSFYAGSQGEKQVRREAY